MTEKEILISQTSNAYDWTNKLIETIPLEKWEIIPGTIESSINWQVGHLIISHYFHSIMVIRGHQMDILQKLPIKDYSDLFTVSAPILSVGKTDSMKLLQDLKIMQQKSMDILAALSDSELNSPLEPTPTPHPIATTKFEAIDWNIKHTMYHCGQIGMLRRIVDQRYDFGLRLAK
ncbi:DinB family protein [Dyadobacter sp. CY345]|uniref:DinB family protein n=1 Tax=Dyadobacter sp. CY345 TaxID=2909335 RepID=UPI001F32D7FE|nr:DinB family protein [Dyadobacter sp. CY345]MCF2443222.1 DinB family protein [Dyadobacter sp. CY345]